MRRIPAARSARSRRAGFRPGIRPRVRTLEPISRPASQQLPMNFSMREACSASGRAGRAAAPARRCRNRETAGRARNRPRPPGRLRAACRRDATARAAGVGQRRECCSTRRTPRRPMVGASSEPIQRRDPGRSCTRGSESGAEGAAWEGVWSVVVSCAARAGKAPGAGAQDTMPFCLRTQETCRPQQLVVVTKGAARASRPTASCTS